MQLLARQRSTSLPTSTMAAGAAIAQGGTGGDISSLLAPSLACSGDAAQLSQDDSSLACLVPCGPKKRNAGRIDLEDQSTATHGTRSSFVGQDLLDWPRGSCMPTQRRRDTAPATGGGCRPLPSGNSSLRLLAVRLHSWFAIAAGPACSRQVCTAGGSKSESFGAAMSLLSSQRSSAGDLQRTASAKQGPLTAAAAQPPSLLARLTACLQYGFVSIAITLFNRAVFSV